ncbi:MAG: hypothetical protein IJ509_02880 [Bacilli bacterium]|nr:hypothetical protein [Bacilli bacterium]
MDRKDLPVEILDNELPKDEGKQYKMFYDEKVRTSGGFADAVFLGAIMVVCFMWGMLAVILR